VIPSNDVFTPCLLATAASTVPGRGLNCSKLLSLRFVARLQFCAASRKQAILLNVPANSPDSQQPERLSERIANHLREITYLVHQGGEQSQYEFKQSVSLAKENTESRLAFVKLCQAMANASAGSERCIVIGANPKEKKFVPVSNTGEFDAANLSKILSSYLQPVPSFQVFTVQNESAQQFVIIEFSALQPRPIVVVREGQAGKARLELGDIWIKKNTDTVKALRPDIDAMVNFRIEEEAEDRARKRLKHLVELGATSPQVGEAKSRVPTFALLVGPKNELQRFAEELIAEGDFRRFRMVLEFARETLVQGWDRIGVRGQGLPEDLASFTAALRDFYSNEFLPSLEALTELGLLTVKYDVEVSWLSAVIDLLLDGFESAKGLQALKSVIADGNPLRWWRPSFDIYVGIRTIAIYVILRKRLEFLGAIIHRIVTIISLDDLATTKMPILFWPFRSVQIQEFNDGRAEFFWQDRVGTSWGKYFGSAAQFLRSSAQLEFLLEFNSYIGNNWPEDVTLKSWLGQHLDKDISFYYTPDLYKKDLADTMQIAELLYDIMARPEHFPPHLAVDATLMDVAFYGKQPFARLAIYGGFLVHLLAWQAEYRRQVYHHWGFHWAWPGRLGELVKLAKEKADAREASS
jgi:hypothetical protein